MTTKVGIVIDIHSDSDIEVDSQSRAPHVAVQDTFPERSKLDLDLDDPDDLSLCWLTAECTVNVLC